MKKSRGMLYLGFVDSAITSPARPRLVEEGVLPLLVSNSMREGKHFHRGSSFVH